MERFEDRIAAGIALADRVSLLKPLNPVVLALPRGGVPVASEISKALSCPLDVLVTKKIGAPHNPELAIGAVGEDGTTVFNQDLIDVLKIDKSLLKKMALQKKQDIQNQVKKFRGDHYPESLNGKDVIVVDDGLATGATMIAALRLIRKKNPRKIIVALPVAAPESLKKINQEADDVICLMTPDQFTAVGLWYEKFDQVSDEEVLNILKESRIKKSFQEREIKIEDNSTLLAGDLRLVPNAQGLIVFAHGSGSSRKSPRNQFVASELNKLGFSTLLFDLLSETETLNRKNVFDIPLLARRLVLATEMLTIEPTTKSLPIGFFGASTGAGAALLAASQIPQRIYAVVSRGGRPDLADDALDLVQAPTLLIVGGNDPPTLEANRIAEKKLKSVELAIVPGATHLFEEEGTLSEVVELAASWFIEHLPRNKVDRHEEILVTELKRKAIPFQGPDSLDALIQHIAKSRIVMLGEATHGTHEFYSLRRMISERLIQNHGFNFIAVEGDWPDCQHINKYIQQDLGKNATEVLRQFSRWPTWMWANEEIAELVENLKKRSIPFYGLDVYSLFESIDAVKDYVQDTDLHLALFVESAYTCFDPFQRDEKAYARHLLQFPDGCRREAISILRKLLRLRTNEMHQSKRELLNAQQSARIVANAEDYYRRMLFGGPDSWNVRDRHMLDTLDTLLSNTGPDSKCIVWAHNSHIGDYQATTMAEEGYVNLGGLARERFGIENVALVGFGTYQGQVLAAPAWEGKATVMSLPQAREFSFEDFCHQTVKDLKTSGFSIIFGSDAHAGALGKRSYGHRAVGVVYDSAHENRQLNYVPTIPAQRYDAFVFVDETTAVHPIKTKRNALDLPETWPGGV